MTAMRCVHTSQAMRCAPKQVLLGVASDVASGVFSGIAGGVASGVASGVAVV